MPAPFASGTLHSAAMRRRPDPCSGKQCARAWLVPRAAPAARSAAVMRRAGARAEGQGVRLRRQAARRRTARCTGARRAVGRGRLFQRSRRRTAAASPPRRRPAARPASTPHARRLSEGRRRDAEGPRRHAPQGAARRARREEKLLAEARATYANGAPVPLPEERGQRAEVPAIASRACASRCSCTSATSRRSGRNSRPSASRVTGARPCR